ncbi:hypothetical protein QJR26_09545 [Clostridium baratii]
MKRIYRIDHYYFKDSKTSNEECLLIECNRTIEEISEIITAIEFRASDLLNETILIESNHILEILEKFFDVKNVKGEYKHLLKETDKEHSGKVINCYAEKYVFDKVNVIKIDRYSTWEYNDSKCKEKYINKDIDKYILTLKEYYDKLLNEFINEFDTK